MKELVDAWRVKEYLPKQSAESITPPLNFIPSTEVPVTIGPLGR
jgi:hypothetical protein